MSDNPDLIFREVDEEVRRDRLIALWKRYGALFVGAVLFIIAAVLGWQWYEAGKDNALKAQSERYQALLDGIEGKEPADVLAFLSGPEAQDFSGGYGALAILHRAGALARTGDHAAAAGLYEQAASEADNRHLAGYAAFLGATERFAAGDADGALAALDRLVRSDAAIALSAIEFMAAIHLSLGDTDVARPMLESLASDAATPPAMRARVVDVIALLDEKGPSAPKDAASGAENDDNAGDAS